jgi:hypothetical protein
MDIESYIEDALAQVEAWEIDPEDIPQVVDEQARLMCGLNLEPSSNLPHHSPYASLRF